MFTCDKCGKDFDDLLESSEEIADRYGFYHICDICGEELLEEERRDE